MFYKLLGVCHDSGYSEAKLHNFMLKHQPLQLEGSLLLRHQAHLGCFD